MTDPSPRPRPKPGPRPAAPAAPVARRRVTRARLLAAVAAVVIVALVVVNVVLAVVRSGYEDVEHARHDAVRNARARIPALLSYVYTDLDDYAKKAPANTTGSFKKDFTTLIASVIAPAARQQELRTTAAVRTVGIVKGNDDQVVLLVLIDQTTSGKGTTTSQVDGSRARVTMRHSGSRWLIADLTPV